MNCLVSELKHITQTVVESNGNWNQTKSKQKPNRTKTENEKS